MKKIIFILILAASIIFSNNSVYAQGCVAIRSTGSIGMEHPGQSDTTNSWVLSFNNRYFKSFRHYIGTTQQKQRIALGNNVINHQYTNDVVLTRVLNSRWSIALDLPIEANSRSQTYTEKGLYNRFSTHSFGEGDIRLTAYAWLWDPANFHKGNIQVGLGIKLPTGNDNVQDYFKTSDSTKTFGPVDQSIQLGDGGTGISAEINAYYNLSRHTSVYGNFYYLSNPVDQNGVSNAHGATASASSIANGSNVMSVPDQYMARVGVNFSAHNWEFSVGARDECLPVHDLIGSSDGFRRPGFIISGEPGVTYKFKRVTVYAFVPVAIVRDRTQSVPDKISTALTGVYTHGDAAFADYVINIGASFRL
jgi:hypothetical protein